MTVEDVGDGAIESLKTHMLALSERYFAAWHSLGPIAVGEKFFTVGYTDFDDSATRQQGIEHSKELDESRTHYLTIATLSTLGVRLPPGSRVPISITKQVHEGLELEIKKVVIEDGDEWDDAVEADREPEILLRKKYLF